MAIHSLKSMLGGRGTSSLISDVSLMKLFMYCSSKYGLSSFISGSTGFFFPFLIMKKDKKRCEENNCLHPKPTIGHNEYSQFMFLAVHGTVLCASNGWIFVKINSLFKRQKWNKSWTKCLNSFDTIHHFWEQTREKSYGRWVKVWTTLRLLFLSNH